MTDATDNGDALEEENQRLANWGWALGLVVPIFGFVIGIVLITRGDRRGPLIVGWSLLVPAVILYLLLA